MFNRKYRDVICSRILSTTNENIRVASRIVREGGLIVYPTDTVYGLGCDPFNTRAVKRVFKAKIWRERPLPILVSSIDQAERIAFFSLKAQKIAKSYWPGPLTLVVPKKEVLPDLVTSNLNTVGVRMPNHDVALQLIKHSNGLLVGTSANRTGEKPATTADEARKQLKGKVDVILDGGKTILGATSTVADMTSRKPRIIRQGPISLKELTRVINESYANST